MTKTKSDGGSTSYYDLPPGARDIGDLIEHRSMPYGIANIFKACYRIGRKAGNDDEYDLNKIIYFAQRELEYVKSRREAEAAAKAKAQHYGAGVAQGNLPRLDSPLQEKVRQILEVDGR